MKTLKVVLPQKRTAVIYGRVKPVNKEWLDSQAKHHKMKLSDILDMYLDSLRDAFPTPQKKKKSDDT